MAKKTRSKLNSKKALAFDLFMSSDLTLKAIAESIQGLNYDTLQRWHKSEKWKEQKAANSITREKIIRNQLIHMSNLQDAINSRGDKYPNASEQDIMLKSSHIIDRLSLKTTLPDYFMVLNEFLKTLSLENLALAKQVADKVQAFLQHKTRELDA